MVNKATGKMSKVNFLCKITVINAEIGTRTIIKSKSELSPIVFIKVVPAMLKTGRPQKTKTIEKAKKDKCRFVLPKLDLFSEKCPLKHDKMTNRFKLMIRISTDKGLGRPIRGHNSFTNNPKNIKKAMLNPTESKIISAALSFSNLRNLKIMMPGTKVR